MRKFFLYWVPTALLLLPMVGSAIYYLVDTPAVIAIFGQMGYPAYTVYFNAFAKILGGIAIALPFPRILKEFAYAGYLYIMLLALQAVWMTMPGIPWTMFVFLVLWAVAYRQFRVFGVKG